MGAKTIPYNCITSKCKNKSDQGSGIYFKVIEDGVEVTYWICIPCWETLTQNKGIYSQIYRNVKERLADE